MAEKQRDTLRPKEPVDSARGLENTEARLDRGLASDDDRGFEKSDEERALARAAIAP